MHWSLALGAAAGISLLASLARALTPAGSVAAWGVGALILGTTGWHGGTVLLAFFVSSSLVGRVVGKPQPIDAKGERRDAAQVLANGGAAALGSLAALQQPELGLWLMSAALAAAAADTWATAWGSGSLTAPRSVLTGRMVPPGTSGGISLRGTLGSVAGAAVVALFTARPDWLPTLLILGTGGMLLDSLLGATLQGRFRCPVCDVPSERRRHRCDTATVQVGGVRWIDNDLVNGMSTTFTMGCAWLLRTF